MGLWQRHKLGFLQQDQAARRKAGRLEIKIPNALAHKWSRARTQEHQGNRSLGYTSFPSELSLGETLSLGKRWEWEILPAQQQTSCVLCTEVSPTVMLDLCRVAPGGNLAHFFYNWRAISGNLPLLVPASQRQEESPAWTRATVHLVCHRWLWLASEAAEGSVRPPSRQRQNELLSTKILV